MRSSPAPFLLLRVCPAGALTVDRSGRIGRIGTCSPQLRLAAGHDLTHHHGRELVFQESISCLIAAERLVIVQETVLRYGRDDAAPGQRFAPWVRAPDA
ncbi:hypothetical protein [Streptomyces virginiae]|uniref:hypothetical protein n=1 Tax=Streptomyces virginiae TaxID=1961 RepID=UPI0022544A4E|nr:hypothetical protein [Streptomyces virginiae]MCX5276242.1 hypothetical protein [Streptomyces virginiae]